MNKKSNKFSGYVALGLGALGVMCIGMQFHFAYLKSYTDRDYQAVIKSGLYMRYVSSYYEDILIQSFIDRALEGRIYFTIEETLKDELLKKCKEHNLSETPLYGAMKNYISSNKSILYQKRCENLYESIATIKSLTDFHSQSKVIALCRSKIAEEYVHKVFDEKACLLHVKQYMKEYQQQKEKKDYHEEYFKTYILRHMCPLIASIYESNEIEQEDKREALKILGNEAKEIYTSIPFQIREKKAYRYFLPIEWYIKKYVD